MSIQIGTTNLVSQLMISQQDYDSGRLVVTSKTSNVLLLRSTTPNTEITIDDFQIERRNTGVLSLQHANTPFLEGNATSVSIYPQCSMRSTFTASDISTFHSNVIIHGQCDMQAVRALSNISIATVPSVAKPFVITNNTQEVLSVTSNGLLSCINTTVASNLTVSRSVSASNVATNFIDSSGLTIKGPLQCTHPTVFDSNVIVRGSLQYLGDLRISSNLNMDILNVRSRLNTCNIFVENVTPVLSAPFVQIQYNGIVSSPSNMVSCVVRPSDLNIPAMVIDTNGKCGMSTPSPQSVLHVDRHAIHATIPYMQVGNNFVIDNSLHMGIGIREPEHAIHVKASPTFHPTGTSILLEHSNIEKQFISTTNKDGDPVFTVFENGQVSIGSNSGVPIGSLAGYISLPDIILHDRPFSEYPFASRYDLFVAPDRWSRLPNVVTDRIMAPRLFGGIDLLGSQLCNVSITYSEYIFASNIYALEVNTEVIKARGFSISNFETDEKNTFVSSCNVAFDGDIYVIGKGRNTTVTNCNVSGKVYIQTQTTLQGANDLNRGLMIDGLRNTSLCVQSSERPFIEFVRNVQNSSPIAAVIGLDVQGQLLMAAMSSMTQKAIVADESAMTINTSNQVMIRKELFFGISPISTTSISQNGSVFRGTTRFVSDNMTTLVQIQARQGTSSPFVGIGTTTIDSRYALDVIGKTRVSEHISFNNIVNVGRRLVLFEDTNDPSKYSGIGMTSSGVIYSLHDTNISHDFNGPNDVNVMRITGTGNIGIGITSPTSRLDVNGQTTIRSDSNAIRLTPATNNREVSVGFFDTTMSPTTAWSIGREIGQTNAFGFRYGTSNHVHITDTGSMFVRGTVSQTSDSNLKKDVTPIQDALTKVSTLNGYTYNRIDTYAREAGLIAQEVERVLPEVVSNDAGTLSLSYGNMACIFVEAIKELKQRVEQLENTIKMMTVSNRIQ